MTTAERFFDAANTMRAHGLVKHTFHGPDGRVCSASALRLLHADFCMTADDDAVLRYLGIATGQKFGSVGDVCMWNNERARTTENATEAFEAAGRLAEKVALVPA